MEKINKILSSFDLQKKLNPKIWHLQNEKFMGDSEGQKYKLNPKVREHLLEIANQFIDSFGIDVVIDDIIIRGSIASYNWSKYSDIDVHVLIDFDQFPPELRDLYSDFFYLKKVVFNDKRNIKIFGFDVELFVEHTDIEAYSDAIYSLMDNEWIKKPSKGKIEYSKEEISKEAEKWMNMIDTLINNTDDEDFDSVENTFNKIKRKLRKYRLDGLKKSGELSLENLVYKVLRRNKYIDKLYNSELKRQDKKLSLKETTLGKPLERMVVTSPFGKVRSGLGSKPHPGVDLGVPSGTELFAIADGVVEDAEIRKDACGGTLKIKHSDGYTSRFCHLKEIDVSKGSSVKQGQKVGSTGGGKNDVGRGHSTGSHLHFELYKNGVKVDPMLYVGKSILNKISIESKPKDTQIITKLIKKPEYENIDIKQVFEEKKNFPFLKELVRMMGSDIKLKEGENSNLENEILLIQKLLKLLDYNENLKIDGSFDEEMTDTIKRFQTDNNLQSNGELTKIDFKVLYFLTLLNNLTQTDIDDIEIEDTEQTYRTPDLLFYQEILNGLQIPITDDNLKFLFALRNSFDKTNTKNNPYNVKDYTGKQIYKDEQIPNFRNIRDGITSTIETLKLPKYKCILESMERGESVDEISDCQILDTLGLQEKIKDILKLNKIVPIKISE